MNDLSNDIKTLDSMKKHLLHASQTSNIKERQIAIDTVWFLINQMKVEKKKIIERYSRQIILKNVGVAGQKKIINSKVLVVGAGGLGCPVIDTLSRAGVGTIGIADHDKVSLSNIHRQNLYNS